MDNIAAYDFLNARFIEFGERHERPVAPMFGRRNAVSGDSPSYFEVCADRWFTITNAKCPLDVQWNGLLNPAVLTIFADVGAEPFEVFWELRCAWFNFESGIGVEQAEKLALEVVRNC